MSSSCDSSMSLYLLMKISGENCAWNRELAQLVSVLDGRKYSGDKKRLQENGLLLVSEVIFKRKP